MTDPDWPSFMRVLPILEWEYNHVWDVILEARIPYCSLYDKGYTSLGSVEDTSPNPALAYTTSKGATAYKPAYELPMALHNTERNGRYSVPNSPAGNPG